METPQPSTVHLVLTTANDRIERVLYQRIHVKIGRQVKSPQEKLAAQEQEISPIEANQDTIRVKDAVFLNAPSPAQMKELDTISIDPVWFKSKVVSRSHAEIWLKDGQVSQINKVYLRDSGSSSGTFLNKMRLSPASKMSRPYPLREGDVIQLGVDYQGRTEEMRVSLQYDEQISLLQKEIPLRFKNALHQLMAATNPYSSHKEQDPKHDHSVDCCICISAIGPFQALFIAPCSHCFHYKCIQHILKETIMFPCPVCRQVANLEASVSMESIADVKNWKKTRSKSSLVFELTQEEAFFELQENGPSEPPTSPRNEISEMDVD